MNMQIDRNGFYKRSKYTILKLTLKFWQKCKFLLLPSNHNTPSNWVNVIVVFAFICQLCIQTTSPNTNITFQRNILHLYLSLPPAKKVLKCDFSRPSAFTFCFQICIP